MTKSDQATFLSFHKSGVQYPRQHNLKELWKKLSEKIKDHLTKSNETLLTSPCIQPDKAKEAESSGGNKLSGQTNKEKPTLPRKKPPKPVVNIRNLESAPKMAARYADKGDKWEVKLKITLNEKIDTQDDVYLSMCLAEDNDNEETKTYLDFRAVQINGKAIEIPDFIFVEQDGEQRKETANKSQVKLGQLQQSKPYNIIAEVKKPEDEIGNIKVALLPILGLRQRKKIEG